MEVDPPPAPAPEPSPAALPGDSFYAVDETAVDAQRQAKPWTQDATYFKRVAVSPAASTKMLAHAQRGCEAGVKAGGKHGYDRAVAYVRDELGMWCCCVDVGGS